MTKRRALWVVAALASVAPSQDVVQATVVQVDGTIVPVQDCGGAAGPFNDCDCAGDIQGCLDEPGGSHPDAVGDETQGAVHSTTDAAQLPEFFLPNTASVVTFIDRAEGAGFENSFGYYNIGDDVTSAAGMAANLHPIFGCGVPAATHTGEVPNYVVRAGESTTPLPATTTVDFAAELTAGRYKGGFIGFYLLTPEGNASVCNCGDFRTAVGTGSYSGCTNAEEDNLSLFGRIYYTQRDLNNDGDFVHHLVYPSADFADRFYFGFEDLFRGGDNDFEDMFIVVTGLSPPCTPSPEVCDGIDNDCDNGQPGGGIDEGSIGTGAACDCNGSGGMTCIGGNKQGDCRTGTTVCQAASLQCQSTVSPATETCNGEDDNCNGVTDDNPTGNNTPCDGTDLDLCNEGTRTCSGGVFVCSDATGTNPELCNGADDDCDNGQPGGGIDEGNPGGGVACDGADGDLCAEGTTNCVSGVLQCNDTTGTIAEACNGVDDDCDNGQPGGGIDEGNPGGGAACDGSDADLCSEGTFSCTGGVLVCGDTSGNNVETCNDADDDCDGQTDEGNPGGGAACDGTDGDLCQEGTTQCMGGTFICNDATGNSLEVCNGLDDDCDGQTDEGNPGGGAACDGSDADLCNEGTFSCSGGVLVCGDTSGNNVETCNNADDDCDGQADEGNPGGGAACDGPDGDSCPEGTTVCQAGGLVCNDATGNSVETCNGLDDDCDGQTDEGNPGGGAACDGSDADLCNEGTFSCSGGVLVCSDVSGNNVETCNNNDDDCDGQTDEGNPGGGAACDGTDGDLCQEGVTTCTGGALVCGDNTGTIVEQCNNVDDDCDGATDEGNPGGGAACSAGVGQCARNGATVCQAGSLVCNATPGAPGSETCNGLDDDCDGSIDETFNVGAACDGVGVCPIGVIECRTLTSTGCSTDPGGSDPGVSAEVCNGLDDDCDGQTDEGLNNLGSCGTDVGECSTGSLRCLGGNPVCVGAVGPTPEVCDGLNNDCDAFTDEVPGTPGDTNGGLIDEGATCGDDTGECEPGTQKCVMGVPDCQGEKGPGIETCNGLDDDCDGVEDNSPTDVGSLCGVPTDVGACDFGATICVNGGLECAGAIGPTIEICNGEDDDCDGETDEDALGEGAPCPQMPGFCDPGTFECQGGMMVCIDSELGTPETCNGVDDDCDGTIDDNPSGIGDPCGISVPPCEPGTTFCINGAVQCVGGVEPTTEVCNSLDDDCDGNKDEGELCSGLACIEGECATPCEPGEFSCPTGKICKEGFCISDPCRNVTCPAVPSGALQECSEGVCVDACSLVTCGGELVCRPEDGLCVPNNCLFVPVCEDDEFCAGDGSCQSDPCFGVDCPGEDEFCRDGGCVKACGSLECPALETCKDGECTPTGCLIECAPGQVCDPLQMVCVNDVCNMIVCDAREACDPVIGDCVPNPCEGVVCPEGMICKLGDCFAPPAPPDTPDDNVYASGGACAVVVGAARRGSQVPGALLFGLAGFAVVAALAARRRRSLRATALLALLLGAASLLLGGCEVDPYCLNCVEGARDGGVDDDAFNNDGGAGDEDAGPDAGCIVGAPELCNDFDDDCDTAVDEDFDKQGDELNCGMCGKVCSKAGSRTECNMGTCEIYECFPGFVDVNMDIDEPFDLSDGCEYECFQSNGGVEACDGLDNDCDQGIDEDFDKQNDEENCGGCGIVCNYFQASTTCTAGVCGFDPLTDCNPGFHDVNGNQLDGCEYACNPTNGGVEICDFVDNDCDGAIDEIFSPSTDPNNCGLCSRVCSFPHATPHCGAGTCFFDPDVDCDPGFHDVNDQQLDGCEYACTPSNGGVEICDGEDNDCDGTVDGATTDSGGACHNAPGGSPAGVCTLTGTRTCVAGALRCVGAPEPSSEKCNGDDDDCDGMTDESPVDVGAVCSPAVGNCTAGIFTCVGGTRMCQRAVGPSPELCNGLDDDCDNSTDENPTDVGLNGPCGTDVGECSPGTLLCAAGNLVCSGGQGPTSEICDGDDDDCNGVNDNNAIDVGGPCGSDVGACVPGTFVCMGGMRVCSGGATGGTESCNNIDDDCDGSTDESVTGTCYTGPPGTQGVGVCAAGSATCTGGSFGACGGQILPGTESCNNLDDDCDTGQPGGGVDEGVTQSCYTGPGGTQGVGVCAPGTRACSAGTFAGQPCLGQVLPAPAEACNNADDDCDGQLDEGVTQTCYTGPGGTLGVGRCVSGNQACSAGAFSGPCVGQVLPAATEACNNIDDDCDTGQPGGGVDEGVTQTCYTGPGGTLGVGRCVAGQQNCTAGVFTGACNGQVLPAASESCNNIDDDCDAQTDEGVTQACYTGPNGTLNVGRCAAGTQACAAGVFSGACVGQLTPIPETCNNIDDDCDTGTMGGGVDEGVTQTCYTGPNGTLNVGRCVAGTQACVAGSFTGQACTGQVLPAGAESCNNIDDDCDAQTDEGVTQACYTGPANTQGRGICVAGTATCSAGTFGTCVGQVNPGIESCNNLDDDCDTGLPGGGTDEGLFTACYTGPGGTLGVGTCSAGTSACVAGAFTGACTGQTLPGTEVCDGLNNDCDALTDEQADGTALQQACYTGPVGTQNVGICVGGTATCAGGAFGICAGEVTPQPERCGDAINNDCDGNVSDTSELCLAAGTELRLDGSSGGNDDSNAGEFHAFDVKLAYGGDPVGRNVYAVWVDKRHGTGTADIFFRRSTDGGNSWDDIINITSSDNGANVAPVIAVGREGANDKVFIAYQELEGGLRRLRLVRSTNSGGSFSNPGSGDLMEGSNDNFHHDLATNTLGTRVVVSWEQLNTGNLTRNVLSRASVDSGNNWSATRTVNVNSTAATANAGRPQATVTSSGRFVWVWREKRGTSTFNVFATFADAESGAIAAANEDRLDGDTMDNRDSDFPIILSAEQQIYATWTDTSKLQNGGADIMFARSTNNSASWGTEIIVDDPAVELSTSFSPTMDIDPGATAMGTDDRVFIAWVDDREGSQIYASRSIDGGATFAAPLRASNSAGGPVSGAAGVPQLVYAGSDIVVIAYEQVVSGVPHIYAATTVNAGVTWHFTDTRLNASTGPAVTPAIARFNSASGTTIGAVVSWIDFRTSPNVNGDPIRVRVGR